MILGPSFNPASLERGYRRFLVSPDPTIKLYQTPGVLGKMKVSLMSDIAAKKKKGTYKESEVNPGGIALYM
jgi:hypothetical protein